MFFFVIQYNFRLFSTIFYSSKFLYYNFLVFFKKLLILNLFCAIIYKRLAKIQFYRGVAQLVARVVWDHEVAGSIPVASTTKMKFCRKLQKDENYIKSVENTLFQEIEITCFYRLQSFKIPLNPQILF